MAENQKISTDYILEKIREAKINEKQLSYEEALKVVYEAVGKGNEKGSVEEKLKIAKAVRTVICHEKGMDESKIHYRLMDKETMQKASRPSASWNTPAEHEQDELFGFIKINPELFTQRKNSDFVRILTHEFGHGYQFFTNDPVLKDAVRLDPTKKGLGAMIDAKIQWLSNDAEIGADRFAANKYYEWIEGYANSGGKKVVVITEKARHAKTSARKEMEHFAGKSVAWTMKTFKKLFGKNKTAEAEKTAEAGMGE